MEKLVVDTDFSSLNRQFGSPQGLSDWSELAWILVCRLSSLGVAREDFKDWSIWCSLLYDLPRRIIENQAWVPSTVNFILGNKAPKVGLLPLHNFIGEVPRPGYIFNASDATGYEPLKGLMSNDYLRFLDVVPTTSKRWVILIEVNTFLRRDGLDFDAILSTSDSDTLLVNILG